MTVVEPIRSTLRKDHGKTDMPPSFFCYGQFMERSVSFSNIAFAGSNHLYIQCAFFVWTGETLHEDFASQLNFITKTKFLCKNRYKKNIRLMSA